MALTIASPRPAPPLVRARPESGRRKRSKACGRKSAGKPGPESRTSMTRSAPAALADRTIGVPAGANRSALSTRLSTASRMRSGSTSAVRPAGAARGLLRAAGQQQPQAGPLRAEGHPVLVTAGQEEELLGDPGQPGDLVA